MWPRSRGLACCDPVACRSVPRSIRRVRLSPRLALGGKRMAMRKYLVLSVLGVCLLVLAPAGAALAGSSAATPTPTATPTIYAGKNSQGLKLRFAVVHTASGPKFDPIFTIMTVRCPVTGDVITIGFGFSGFRVPIKNGKFSFVLNDISDRFLWSGTVTSTKASGPESDAMPAFDHEGGLQNCSTGPLSWTAQAVTAGSSAATAPSAATSSSS